MIFQYKALDKTGKEIFDFVDAPTVNTARQKLRQKGLYVTQIEEQDVTQNKKSKIGPSKKSYLASSFEKFLTFFSTKSSVKQVGIFSRQLATLLKAGLPLPLAIADIIEQIDHKYFKNIVTDIKNKLEEGANFSTALRQHKSIFSDMYVNMVQVGENLGSLDQVIERLAEMEQKKNILKNKVQSALWYPSFMLFFAIAVVIFLMINVIPTITEMFTDQGRTLPIPTKIVIATSDFLSQYWLFIPLFITILLYIYQRYQKTEAGKRKIDELKLKIPLFQNLYRKIIVFKFTQNLGILLNNKVDIIKSFEIVEKIVDNITIEEKISDSAKKIKEGSSVSRSLGTADFLPKLVLGMMTAGEASDNLDKMLLNIGQVYETEIDLTITSLTSLIEPIIIVFMGVIVGTIVMSVMLPMMEMNLLVQ